MYVSNDLPVGGEVAKRTRATNPILLEGTRSLVDLYPVSPDSWLLEWINSTLHHRVCILHAFSFHLSPVPSTLITLLPLPLL